jgi:hypothetical protein
MNPASFTGIRSLADWRFWAVMALHIAAWLLLLETGSPRPLDFTRGVPSLAVAFLLAATVAWHWKLLGDPTRPHQFLAHLALLLSLFLLVVRLQTRARPNLSVLEAIAAYGKWAAELLGTFPTSLIDVLASPATALFFVATCFALALRRPYAIAVLTLLAVVALALAVGRDDFGARPPFFAGLALLGLACWLQYENADERAFWQAVLGRLASDPAPRGDLELKIRLLRRLRQENRPLTDAECLGTFERALDRTEDDPALRATSVRILRQMVRSDGLVQIHETAAGRVLALNPELTRHATDTFSLIAIVPRTICILLVALVWILSPIDILPDSLPVIGVLDDVLVGLLGGHAVGQLLDWANLRRQRRLSGGALLDLSGPRLPPA